MPKVSPERWAELEGFWRHRHEAWKSSTLNQRECCELHGLPLKRLGNWRDRFKVEDEVRQAGLLYRRGGLGHMASHMTDREAGPVSTGYVPSGGSLPQARRSFRLSRLDRCTGNEDGKPSFARSQILCESRHLFSMTAVTQLG
jgi:hypothetical protein